MTYGERLTKAMIGRYATNQELADALTKLLKSQGRYERDIPDATIQSARTRADGSKYTLDFAYLCRVDPYWLAHGVGSMRPAPLRERVTEDPLLGELLDVWDRLPATLRERLVGFAAGLPRGPTESGRPLQAVPTKTAPAVKIRR